MSQRKKGLLDRYGDVLTLCEYISSRADVNIITKDDTQRYKEFIKTTLVIPDEGKNLSDAKKTVSFSTNWTHKDVVMKVVNDLCKKNLQSKNVLGFGFKGFQVGCGAPSKHYFNNSNLVMLPDWKLLHSRIGDYLMFNLLKMTSIFVHGSKGAYVQLTGKPIYDRTPRKEKKKIGKISCYSGKIVKHQNTERLFKKKTPNATTSHQNQTLQKDQIVSSGKKRKYSSDSEADKLKKGKRLRISDTVTKSEPQEDVHKRKSVKRRMEVGTECNDLDRQYSNKKRKLQPYTSVLFSNDDILSEGRIHFENKSGVDNNKNERFQNSRNMGEKKEINDNEPVVCKNQEKKTVYTKASENCGLHEEENDSNQEKRRQAHDETTVRTKANEDIFSEGERSVDFGINKVNRFHEELTDNPSAGPIEKLSSEGNIPGKIGVTKVHKLCEEEKTSEKNEGDHKVDGNRSENPKGNSYPSEQDYESDSEEDLEELNDTSRIQETTYNWAYSPIMICYNRLNNEKFNSSCILEKAASNRSVRELLNSIFFTESFQKKLRVPKRYLHVEKLLKDFQKRHQRCTTLVLLDSYCGVPGSFKSKGNKTQYKIPDNLETLIGMTVSRDQVFEFLKSRLLQVIPLDLWGSLSNRNTFIKFVRKFVWQGKFEKLYFEELMLKLKVADCKWAYLDHEINISNLPINTIKKQQEMIYGLYHWLMTNYVLVLLKNSFYITENCSSKNVLVFYRKVVWNKIQSLAMEAQVKSGTFKEISKEDATKNGQLCSRLRFVPKVRSCRPIVNTKFSTTEMECKNQKMIFDVLTYVTKKQPVVIGSSIRSLSDIHRLWKKFVTEYRTSSYSKHPLYFVKTDIVKCFDSILPEKLLTVVSTVLKTVANIFVINYYAVVSKRGDKIVTQHKKIVKTIAEFRMDVVSSLAKDSNAVDCVFINKIWTKFVPSKLIVARLKALLMNNIVKLSGRYYLRTSGITQGFMLSTLLTQIYYGYMETACLYQISQDGIMFRLVDDFLLVTPHLSNAKKFLKVLMSGIDQFACKVAVDKTLTNFPVTFKGQTIKSASGFFPYCGILINDSTLEVLCDYSSYAKLDLRYVMTISDVWNMENKLNKLMFTKSVALYIDPVINKKETCLQSIYEIFLVLAYRFHSYQLTLPQESKPQNHPDFYKDMLHRLFVKLYMYAKRTLYTSQCPTSSLVSCSEYIWYGCKATLEKFGSHRSMYKVLIKKLQRLQQAHKCW